MTKGEEFDDQQFSKLEEFDDLEREEHFNKLNWKMIPCNHYINLRQDRMIPIFLYELHVYVSHTNQEKKKNG